MKKYIQKTKRYKEKNSALATQINRSCLKLHTAKAYKMCIKFCTVSLIIFCSFRHGKKRFSYIIHTE